MTPITILAYFMLIFGYIILFFGIALMVLSVFNIFKEEGYKKYKKYEPKFSLIAPAHNEEPVIERTIKRFLQIEYPMHKKELIIINDASTDDTEGIAMKYAGRVIDMQKGTTKSIAHNYQNITLVNRRSGGKGKSFALNDGKKFASGDILFFFDADVQITKNVLRKAAKHFSDRKVGSITGYVDVAAAPGLWNKFISFEYIVGQKILRRGFNVMGVHYIIPGGCAIFRKELVDEIGDYHHDTLAEDTDFTWRVVTETDARINFDPSITVIADEPTTLEGLWDQRVRWARGNLEVTWKNRNKVGRKEYGRPANLGYPFWISSMVLPFAFIFSALGFLIITLFGGIALNVAYLLGFVLAVTFYVSWFAATMMNKGKYWLEGLLTPGIPVLISITAFLFWPTGIVGLINTLSGTNAGIIIGTLLSLWIIVSIPGTYLALKLARNGRTKAADILQLLIFGYWMFTIVTTVEAYIREFKGSERVWIRAQRESYQQSA
ncbi:MAG: glycosyltransferase family 2 protein [Candidatus Micrarchaeota archaeon]|nr:glycosyltransferase family 2 protein [Candidatus Micrarchaeota archaeon]